MTDALLNLTAENLAAFGDKVIDIAHGLGKKVSVMGISGRTWVFHTILSRQGRQICQLKRFIHD
jgi:hypothetical protein